MPALVLMLALGPAASAAAEPGASPSSVMSSPVMSSSVAATVLPGIRTPLPGATVPAAPGPVLPAVAASAEQPTAAGLEASFGGLLTRPALGPSVSAEVLDAASGASLFARQPARAAVPASATKILTAVAALSALGPATTLPTRAVMVPPDTATGTADVVLVGGGDVMLAPGAGDPTAVQGHAGLGDLATAAASTLRARGVTSVRVRLDDTLFTGPAVNPAWSPGDVAGGFVAPVMAVEMTVGVTRPGTPPKPGLPAARFADPAMAAAKQFAVHLSRAGLKVTGGIARASAPAGSVPLAEVRSAQIADIVEHDLTDSDNTTAEALARLVAVSVHGPATFTGGGNAVLARIAALRVPVTGARLLGGSGLGTRTVVPARTIVHTLALAASPDHPELRALLTGLPVAGASGTLSDRFTGPGLAAGAGVVRAKTGTLRGVSSLAGTVVDADGRLLVFAVLADAVPATEPGRAALDAAAAALASCGCR